VKYFSLDLRNHVASACFEQVFHVVSFNTILRFTLPLVICFMIFVHRPLSGRAVFFRICAEFSGAQRCSGSYDTLEHGTAKGKSIGHELLERGLI